MSAFAVYTSWFLYITTAHAAATVHVAMLHMWNVPTGKRTQDKDINQNVSSRMMLKASSITWNILKGSIQ